MADCLFCKICNGDIPATKVYEDSQAVAFQDLNPQAPMHVLVVPRKHLPTLNDITPADHALMGHLFSIAAKIAKDRGYAQPGWRAVLNCNQEAGQTVFHIHMHVLGGRPLSWPPG